MGEATETQTQILEALHRRFPSLATTPSAASSPRGRRALVLAVGPAGLRQALQGTNSDHIVSLFTSGASFRELTLALPGDVKRRLTAIFAEPSPAQQIQLIEKLFDRRMVVGVLFGNTTAYLEPLVRHAAQAAKFELLTAHHQDGSSISRSLLKLNAADVLLALPDRDIYNPNTLRDVLETTYRRNMPLIGYSAGLAHAGAMACAYATLDDILSHAVELVEAVTNTATLPEPQFPRYWRVAVNERVARSMNLAIDEAVRLLGHQPPRERR